MRAISSCRASVSSGTTLVATRPLPLLAAELAALDETDKATAMTKLTDFLKTL